MWWCIDYREPNCWIYNNSLTRLDQLVWIEWGKKSVENKKRIQREKVRENGTQREKETLVYQLEK